MANQATLVIIKPDAIQRGFVGAVLSQLETLRLECIGAKAVAVSRELAEAHYQNIREKPFFVETVEYLQGTRHGMPYVLAFVLWGPEAVAGPAAGRRHASGEGRSPVHPGDVRAHGEFRADGERYPRLLRCRRSRAGNPALVQARSEER